MIAITCAIACSTQPIPPPVLPTSSQEAHASPRLLQPNNEKQRDKKPRSSLESVQKKFKKPSGEGATMTQGQHPDDEEWPIPKDGPSKYAIEK
jgi:hypothetical protein